jgi:hypothetical protein
MPDAKNVTVCECAVSERSLLHINKNRQKSTFWPGFYKTQTNQNCPYNHLFSRGLQLHRQKILIFGNYFCLGNLNPLKVFYLKMFLYGRIENFNSFMCNEKQAKMLIFTPKIGVQRQVL